VLTRLAWSACLARHLHGRLLARLTPLFGSHVGVDVALVAAMDPALAGRRHVLLSRSAPAADILAGGPDSVL